MRTKPLASDSECNDDRLNEEALAGALGSSNLLRVVPIADVAQLACEFDRLKLDAAV